MKSNKIHTAASGLLRHVMRWNQVSNLCDAMTYKKITVENSPPKRNDDILPVLAKFMMEGFFFIDSQFASLIFINLKFTGL